MFIATLGGLIKDYRIKKRLSQLEVSLRIGWKDTSRLSKIEQGRVGKPTRETIEKVIRALELTEQERGEFLLIGGYLPTDVEIRKAIKEIGLKVDDWPYPSYVVDFSWRSIYTNQATILTLNLPKKYIEDWNKRRLNMLRLSFLSKDELPIDILKGEDKNNLKPFKLAQIATYKTENFKYQNEKWYQKTVQSLMNDKYFRKLWPVVDLKMYYKKLYDYEYKRLTGIYEGKKRSLNFHLLTAKMISDPRFQMVMCYPADSYTEIYCSNLRKTLKKKIRPSI